MNSGDLRHRVELQQRVKSRNAVGEETYSWLTYATVWAAVEPLTGRELYEAQQISAEVTVRVRVRYLKSVSVEHRVLFDSRGFNVNFVQNIEERNRELVLLCKEAA